MTKTLNKLGKEGNFLNSIKDTYENILNGERVNDSPHLKIRKKTRASAPSILYWRF